MINEYQPATIEQEDEIGSDNYLRRLEPHRTARGASESGHNAPEESVVSDAVRQIRNDITPVFREASSGTEYNVVKTLEELKADYWDRARKVGSEHGTKEGYTLDQYFTVGRGRSYAEIKELIEEDYDEGSVPRSILAGIDAYYRVLRVNPAHAATIMMELFDRGFTTIRAWADEFVASGECSPSDATAQAIALFVNQEVPAHIENVLEKFGSGDTIIHGVMNKPSFYPTTYVESKEDTALTLSSDDAAGLVEVYDIQSRPYDEVELAIANDIAQLPSMQAAMIRVHEGIVAVSKDYLAIHPERATGNLKNFSEIFVPDNDDPKELLPNPKLLLAMVNNILPAVAISVMRRGGSVETVNEQDVIDGIRVATGEFKLFQTRIGQFDNENLDDDTVQLESTFKVVCPAGSMFPNYMSAKLAPYFQEEQESRRQVLAT